MDAKVTFDAAHRSLDDGDERWRQQVQSLIKELKDIGRVSRVEAPAQQGKKGVELAQIILALGSAGALTAAVQIFKAWLDRDQNRSLRIRAGAKTLVVEGEKISEATLREALQAAIATSASHSE